MKDGRTNRQAEAIGARSQRGADAVVAEYIREQSDRHAAPDIDGDPRTAIGPDRIDEPKDVTP
jgi:hypothetical protein